ncbi:hypothetical protein D3C76_912320 [compost metagenome]
MKWLGLVIRTKRHRRVRWAAKQLQRFTLRGCRKGEIADVLAAATSGQRHVHHIFATELLFPIQLLGHQYLTQLARRAAGLA